jgi:hypothetical protein
MTWRKKIVGFMKDQIYSCLFDQVWSDPEQKIGTGGNMDYQVDLLGGVTTEIQERINVGLRREVNKLMLLPVCREMNSLKGELLEVFRR